MAISAVTVHVNSGAAAATFTSSSFTPTANGLHIAFMNARTGAAAIPTITDSQSNTWTLVPGTNLSVSAGNLKCSMYTWTAGPTPAAMTATVNSSGALACSLLIVAYTGASTDTSNIGINQNAAGDPAPSNSAMAATSTGLAFNSQNAGAAPTATPTAQGYTSIVNSAPSTNLRHSFFHDQTSPANSVSWTSTGTDSVGILWELKDASAGGAVTGTITQAATATTQALSGTVTAPAITGTAVQLFKPPTQALTGFIASGTTGTIVQSARHASQALSGSVTAPAVTGLIGQTGPHPSQALIGFTPTQEPDRRVGGGFANWSTPLDKKRRKRWEEIEEARLELRDSIRRLLQGEPAEAPAARSEALAAVSTLAEARRDLADVAELRDLRTEIQLLERAALRLVTTRRTRNQDGIFMQFDGVEAAQWQALQAFKQEEEAIVALLA